MFTFTAGSHIKLGLPCLWHPVCGCLGGEIGRHKGLKIPRLYGRAGSIPALGTIIQSLK